MKRKVKPTLQLTRSECGICCLVMLADFYGFTKPVRFFREKIDTGRDGISIRIIKEQLIELNFDVTFYKMTQVSQYDDINIKYLPAIAYTKKNHFIILERYNKKNDTFVIVDPAQGRIKVGMNQLLKVSEDLILVAQPNSNFNVEKTKESFLQPLKFLINKVSNKLVISLLLSILTYIFTLSIPLLIQVFIDNVSMKTDKIFSDIGLSYAIGAMFLFLLISFARNRIVVNCEVLIDRDLLLNLMNHLLKLPFKYFESRSTGDIIFRINLLNSIRLMISEGLVRGIIDIGSVIFIIAYMAIIAPPIIVIVFFILAIIFVLSNIVNNKIVSLNKEELVELTHVANIETEIVEMIFDIKCLRAEELFLSRLKSQYKKFQRHFEKREMLSRCNISLLQFFQLFMPLLLLIINLLFVNQMDLTIGQIVAYYSLSNMIITNSVALLQEISNMKLMKNYIIRINDILNEEVEFCDGQEVIKEFKNINIEKICFAYSRNSKPLLKNIDLKVNQGQRIAIVGTSGAGKSTLVKLILGLYEPISGSVKYNGYDIKQIEKKALKKLVGIMPQDVRLFNESIRYNLTLGDSTVDEKMIVDALKKASIYDEVMSMPMKLDTVMSSGGGNLSGGQRQRIALARILVNNPQLIILDEATSSLDGINEKEIMNVLSELECTQIIISHRFSTISQADYIYLLEDGSVVEKGTIEELIEKKELFFDLFSKQIDTYKSLVGRNG